MWTTFEYFVFRDESYAQSGNVVGSALIRNSYSAFMR